MTFKSNSIQDELEVFLETYTKFFKADDCNVILDCGMMSYDNQ